MRNRVIKVECWKDQKLGALLPIDRLLYIALWNFCDDKGRCEGSPAYLRSMVFPYDDNTKTADVEASLASLARIGRIVLYQHNGDAYLCVPRLILHQHIQQPSPSKIPPPPAQALQQLGLEARLVEELVDSRPWAGRSNGAKRPLSDDAKTTGKAAINTAAEEVFNEWRKVMKKTNGVIFSPERKTSVVARLEQGYTAQQLKEAVWGCRVTPHNMGENDRNTPYNDLTLICRNAANVDRFRDAYAAWAARKRAQNGDVSALDHRTQAAEPITSLDLFGGGK